MDPAIPSDLRERLESLPGIAVAFSGGTDSSYLLYAASRCCGRFAAYSAETPFRSPVERRNAERIAGMLGIEVRTIRIDPLSSPGIAANGPDRCYLCKRAVFSAICAQAAADGFPMVCDGTNASDDPATRPGMRALEEMGVSSPLRDCGLGKADVRRLSERAGLPCWNTPSDSCLATRIAVGTAITPGLLERTARAEEALRGLGLSGIRVRCRPDGPAVLEIPDGAEDLSDSMRARVDGILVPEYGGYTVSRRRAE